jgi:hypothetical protein
MRKVTLKLGALLPTEAFIEPVGAIRIPVTATSRPSASGAGTQVYGGHEQPRQQQKCRQGEPE